MEIHADFFNQKKGGKNAWQHSENPDIDGSMYGGNNYFLKTITCSLYVRKRIYTYITSWAG
jgi:hypothetical protein